MVFENGVMVVQQGGQETWFPDTTMDMLNGNELLIVRPSDEHVEDVFPEGTWVAAVKYDERGNVDFGFEHGPIAKAVSQVA